jgi:hypothetical protein
MGFEELLKSLSKPKKNWLSKLWAFRFDRG